MFESEEIEEATLKSSQLLCDILGLGFVEYLQCIDKDLESNEGILSKIDHQAAIVSGLTLFYARALNEFILPMNEKDAKEYLDSLKFVISNTLDNWFVRTRKIGRKK